MTLFSPSRFIPLFRVIGFFLFVFAISRTSTARAEVAIAIRYFKLKGTSHFHLFLYSDDGKVIRELTAPEDAQDTSPMFSVDGNLIYFTREQHGKKQIFSIQPNGDHLQAVDNAPAGYPPQATDGVYSDEKEPEMITRGDDLFLKTPDEKQEVVLKSADNFKRQDPSFEANGFGALSIRDTASGQETRVPTTGEETQNFCYFVSREKSPFLAVPGLRVAFYLQWQGSTDGPRLGALDLLNNRAVFLSRNPATPFAHGTRAGFFSVCEDRYQPLGETGHTVNCLYLDWWDANLQRTRFARAISIFGGASVRVKGQPQLDIPIK